MKSFHKPKQFERKPRVNNQIRVPEVSVIDDQGNHLGPMKTEDALRLAQERNLDLVEISPQAKPPLAKILDYGKYMYQKDKKQRESKAKSQDIKIIQLGFKTGQHDMIIRSEQTDGFLEKGHRVQIILKLRGREKGMADIARKKLSEFMTYITQSYASDEGIKSNPSGLTVIIKPDTKK